MKHLNMDGKVSSGRKCILHHDPIRFCLNGKLGLISIEEIDDA